MGTSRAELGVASTIAIARTSLDTTVGEGIEREGKIHSMITIGVDTVLGDRSAVVE